MGLLEFSSMSSKCNATFLEKKTEEYMVINHRNKLKELIQSEERPRHIAITSQEAFEEGIPFFRSLGEQARNWDATHLRLSGLSITENEANKHIKVLVGFWGKIQKIDLSHNKITQTPKELIKTANTQVKLIDLSDNPIPAYLVDNG